MKIGEVTNSGTADYNLAEDGIETNNDTEYIFTGEGEETVWPSEGTRYRIAGYFRMVEIFVFFVLEHHPKIKTVFYVTILSCTKYLTGYNYIVHTNIYTNDNYPLYGNY